MLLRNALGETLRDARTRQNRTLRDVSTAANVSLGYLSEVERGRKEASSELLASICDALDVELSEVLDTVSRTIRTDEVTTALRAVGTTGKASVVTNSTKAGMGTAQRPKLDPTKLDPTKLDPRLRIVLPYTTPRPGASVR